jgi:GH35 family endo-1,4-beta-xylanase
MIMNGYNKLILAVAICPALVGCADYLDTNNFSVDQPESLAQYEYLNDYKTLTSYIDFNAHPDFKLGAGIDAAAYSTKGAVYMLTNTNFNQVTPGNAMKYSSIVGETGTMDFSTVKTFVAAAKAAGISIFGHTLCWHEQQTYKYLNSLIADIPIDTSVKDVVVDGEIDYTTGSTLPGWASMGELMSYDKGYLSVINPSATANNWDNQYQVLTGVDLDKGEDYTLTILMRGSASGELNACVGSWSSQATSTLYFGTDWEEVTFDFTAADASNFVLLQSGHFVGEIDIKDVKITHLETPVAQVEVTKHDSSRCVIVESDDMQSAAWDTQFWIAVGNINAGDTYSVSMDIRADKKASSSTQVHTSPGNYLYWSAIGSPTFTTEWETYTATGSFSGFSGSGQTIAFNLNEYQYANKYYFKNISIKVNGEERVVNGSCSSDDASAYTKKEKRGDLVTAPISDGFDYTTMEAVGGTPRTDEEKDSILTAEMERWIKGMMDATEGYVTAWDVVNEPISGSGGDRYDLQSAATDSDPEKKFYWQDYLGENYVRVPIKFARQYFEEAGGNPSDLKLFINDYNLESDWDNNKKLKSLISWIEQWESDGVTKIDGIGTQMHVSLYLNPTTQASKEAAIENHFKLLAATGKLIRISELDMGIVDADGNTILTDNVTFEQKKAMGDFYKFIIKKYFEIIPAAQQYGICQWAQTDSPAGSSWRAGQPIGLWDVNYARKPAYAGFAEGLQEGLSGN